MTTPVLTTERLLLRPVELADAPAVQAIFPQSEIVEFLGAVVPWPYPADGALGYIRDVALPQVADGRAWHWSIRLRNEPERLIGMINLVADEEINRGFWLDPAFHRRGLMREAADAVTAYWFNELGQTVLRIPKAVANAGSRAISVREGARVVWRGPKEYVSGWHDSELWEVTAEEWQAARRRSDPR